MYLRYYWLRRAPFHITPDPDFLFLGSSHREALAAVIYGVRQRKGFIELTGEVGVGKTTVLRSYLERVDRQSLKIYLFNANLSFEALLKTLCEELEVKAAERDPAEMVSRIHGALVEHYRNRRNVVLIIDEAQNMPLETLENLRMLSNLESSKDKLLQIILVGQPELEEVLRRRELRQLRQRIAVRYRILPLTSQESRAYILHRLSKATSQKMEAIFAPRALRLIIRKGGGIPRVLNILCDNALITGYGYTQRPVTVRIVREVVRDFEGRARPLLLKRLAAATLALVLLGALAWLGFDRWARHGEGSGSVSAVVRDSTESPSSSVPEAPSQGPKEEAPPRAPGSRESPSPPGSSPTRETVSEGSALRDAPGETPRGPVEGPGIAREDDPVPREATEEKLPDDWRILKERAAALVEEGRREEAVAHLEKALRKQKEALAVDDLRIADTVSALIGLYETLGKRREAESLNNWADSIWGR